MSQFDFDGEELRALRLAAGLSLGQLSDRTGLRQRVVSRIESNDPSALDMITARQLIGIAEAIGATPTALLRPRERAPMSQGDPADDPAILAGQLALSHNQTPWRALATALAWDQQRLTTARERANAALEDVGLTIAERTNGWQLTATRAEAHASDARLVQARADLNGMDQQRGRVLYGLYNTKSNNNGRRGMHTRTALAYFQRIGALETDNGALVLSERVRFALNIR
jgi:transcriptional regulator with XRE-family HTH domain